MSGCDPHVSQRQSRCADFAAAFRLHPSNAHFAKERHSSSTLTCNQSCGHIPAFWRNFPSWNWGVPPLLLKRNTILPKKVSGIGGYPLPLTEKSAAQWLTATLRQH